MGVGVGVGGGGRLGGWEGWRVTITTSKPSIGPLHSTVMAAVLVLVALKVSIHVPRYLFRTGCEKHVVLTHPRQVSLWEKCELMFFWTSSI